MGERERETATARRARARESQEKEVSEIDVARCELHAVRYVHWAGQGTSWSSTASLSARLIGTL